MVIRICLRLRKASCDAVLGAMLTMVTMPLAKNIPANVTMNGCISRYATSIP